MPPTIGRHELEILPKKFKQVLQIKGGIKKKLVFFLRKTPKGGGRGLAKSEISLSEKTEIFLEKVGGSHLFQKGVIIKNW